MSAMNGKPAASSQDMEPVLKQRITTVHASNMIGDLLRRYSLKSFQAKLSAELVQDVPDSSVGQGSSFWDNERVWELVFKVQQEVSEENGFQNRAAFVTEIRKQLEIDHKCVQKATRAQEQLAEKLKQLWDVLKAPRLPPEGAGAPGAPGAEEAAWDRACLLGILDGRLRLTGRQGRGLVRELTEVVSSEAWQGRLADALLNEPLGDYLRRREELVLEAQALVLPKYGLQARSTGVKKTPSALEIARRDPDFSNLYEEFVKASTTRPLQALRRRSIVWDDCLPPAPTYTNVKTNAATSIDNQLTREATKQYMEEMAEMAEGEHAQACMAIFEHARRLQLENALEPRRWKAIEHESQQNLHWLEQSMRMTVASRLGFEKSSAGAKALHEEASFYCGDPELHYLVHRFLTAIGGTERHFLYAHDMIQESHRARLAIYGLEQ